MICEYSGHRTPRCPAEEVFTARKPLGERGKESGTSGSHSPSHHSQALTKINLPLRDGIQLKLPPYSHQPEDLEAERSL